MDKNKIISVESWTPIVRIANHHKFSRSEPWRRVNPDAQLILCISGKLEFGYLDKPGLPLMTIKAGQVLFIAPDRKHTIQGLTDDTVISGFHFEPIEGLHFRDVQMLLDPFPNTRTALRDDLQVIQSLFIELASVFESHRRYRGACLQTLSHHILLRLAAQWRAGEGDHQTDRRVEEMLTYIRENFRDPINRQSLGVRFGMTPEHVNYLFKKELNTTPTKVINRERCIRAYDLLSRHGMSVKEVAYDVGFTDPAYFSRVFRTQMHQAPNDVKRP